MLALLLVSCGVAVDAPLLMTCDIASQGKCEEWRGNKMDDTNKDVNFDSLCASTLNGQIAPVCAGNAVGKCVERPSVAKRVVITHYYAPSFSTASASADCSSMKGTFEAAN